MSKSLSFALIIALLLGAFLLWKNSEDSTRGNGKGSEKKRWKDFSSSTGNFKVQFPSLPQHANEILKDPKTKEKKDYDMYVSEGDHGNIYMINVITFMENKHPLNEEVALKGIVNDMLSANPNSTMKRMDMATFQKAKAIDFSIEKDQTTIDGKAFIVGKKLYVLSHVAENSKHQPEDFNFFVNTFQLLSEKKETSIQ